MNFKIESFNFERLQQENREGKCKKIVFREGLVKWVLGLVEIMNLIKLNEMLLHQITKAKARKSLEAS